MRFFFETKIFSVWVLLMVLLTTGSCTQEDSTGTDPEPPVRLEPFNNPNGVFILNEGNMTTENGSLTYIYPDGKVVDDAYKVVNGTELGNVCQDMAFYDEKIYVISQNGNQNAVGTTFDNDGMLVVMDGKTLKKEMAFTNDELAALDWPTHIAVLDQQHVYIRDNKGIYRLNTETRELTFVAGSEKAPKASFVTMDHKIYTFSNKNYLCSILEISQEKDSVNKISLPYSAPYKEIYGIAGSEDGHIWLAASGFGKYYTARFQPETKELVSRQISVEPNTGNAGVAFCVKGNEIFYANGTAIYRQVFDDAAGTTSESGLDQEEMLVDLSALDSNAGLLYNGLAVHPVTGHVFINSLKGYAQYATNQIWEFDFEASTETPVAKYENHTSFPAGFFFYPQTDKK